MAMLMMEGFEGYGGTNANAIRRRRVISQSNTGALVTGRLGGFALNPATSVEVLFTEFGDVTSFVFGFAMYVNGISVASGDLIQFMDADSEQLVLRVAQGGVLFLDLAGVNIDKADSQALRIKNWTYIEVKATIDNSVGSYEIRVDGIVVMSDSGVDTQSTANSFINRVDTQSSSTTDQILDDIYLLDDTGLTNTDFLGDIQIETMYPDVDGNRNDMTPLSGLTNYEMVDDGHTPDDDTTYNSGGVVGDDELYGYAAMTATFDTVYALQVRNLVRKEDSGYRTGATLIRSNVDELEGTPHPVSTDWRYYDQIYEVDPQGGGAWTETRINALEGGFTVKT